jgi:hypothetical protein
MGATSGNRSRATSGNRSRATSGNRFRATSGNRSRALRNGAALVIAAGASLLACAAEPPPQTPASARPLAVATAPSAAAASPQAPLTPVIAPTEPPAMAALARRLAAVVDGNKPQVTTYSLDLESLPRVTVPEILDAKTAAKLDRAKLQEDPDISVKSADGYARQYMLSFSFKDPAKVTFGHIHVNGQYGVTDGWFGDGYGSVMNAYLTCGGSGELTPIHWETVKLSDGQLAYTMADGVLDRQSCKILGVHRTTATAKPLLPRGILYGFRACVGSCTEDEELTLVFPRSAASAAGSLAGGAAHASGSFSAVSFPLQRGGGGAFVARLNRRDVASWQVAAATPKGQDKPSKLIVDEGAYMNASLLSTFEIGVEVSQAHDDEHPLAVAYMDIDPSMLPPIPAPPPAAPTPAPAPKAQGNAAGSSRIGFNDLVDPFAARR